MITERGRHQQRLAIAWAQLRAKVVPGVFMWGEKTTSGLVLLGLTVNK